MRVKPFSLSMREKGFTIIELLVAMGVGAIVMMAVMTAFISQHNSYLAQENVVEMQQNLKVAMDMISNDIRSAGYNPAKADGVGIITALPGRLGFTRDLNGDGDTLDGGEAITYGFSLANDNGKDGLADTGTAPLGRNIGSSDGTGGSGFQQLAQNFQAIEFLYLLSNGTQTTMPTAAQLDSIRSISISILAVTSSPDKNFTNNTVYTTASGATWGSGDNLRRRMLITTVKCRNLGL